MPGVAVLVYDGDCGFCTSSARWLHRRAPGMDVVPWQRADLTSLGLTAEQCSRAVQFVGPRQRESGGGAVAAALRECHQPYRAVGAALATSALRPIVESGYAWVAAHRHRLPGGSPACASDRDEGALGGTRGQRAAHPVPPAEG